MKKVFRLLFSLCALLTVLVSMGAPLSGITSDTEREIDLKGDLPGGKQRSLIKPVETFITGESIEVNFNAGLGMIVISIYDEGNNVAYQQTVSTYSGMHTVIDVSSLGEGEYVIEFTNSQGQYLSGNFVIQEKL